MANQRILIFVVTAAVMLGFWIFIKKAKFGFGLRATAQDRDAAILMGVNVKRIYTITFGLSCARNDSASVVSAHFTVQPHLANAWQLRGRLHQRCPD